jgi:NADH dehydrogenase
MSQPHVVIIGAGFAGLSVARALADAPVRITILDRNNYHLFQPLLYQVATAALSPAEIAEPIRSVLSRQKNAEMLLGEVVGIDLEKRIVRLEADQIGYDYLVVATGARHSYFGHDDWAAHAPALKSIDDALTIRRQLLLAFEHAEATDDMHERQRLTTFVVIGGGPTGVELAGAIGELSHQTLVRDFRRIDTRKANILLVEAGPRILSSFPERLSRVAVESLRQLGVETLTDSPVETIDERGIVIGGKRLEAATVLWAAGVQASRAALWLGAEADRSGRVKVTPTLNLPGHDEVFVIGDTAAVPTKDGNGLPGVAPVAKQEGLYVAKYLAAKLAGKADLKPFRYKDQGNLATIGRNHAVADFGWLRLTGLPGWLLWGFAHVFFLIGFRNRIVVTIHWLWIYLTGQRGARLITRL